jgi:pentose-5-phosphate-3-epimerase
MLTTLRLTKPSRKPVTAVARHISRECDLYHDVCHMMLDEQDKFIQHIMANHDTVISATAESTTHTGTRKGTLMEREVDDSDFARSSR